MSHVSLDHLRQQAREGLWSKIFSLPWPAVLASFYLLILVLWMFAPAFFTAGNPLAVAVKAKLQAPSLEHWFGTDHLGRDVLVRIIYGTKNSLIATLTAVFIGLFVGTAVGLLSGFGPRRLDAALMRLVDVLLAIPNLLLSLAIVTALGFGLIQVAIAVGVGSVGSFARIMRSEVVRVKNLTFIESTLLLGASPLSVAVRHVLPHSWGPVVALSAIEFGTAVLSVSALSFLGFGAPPPEIEWGLLVAEGRKYINTSWWLIAFPGAFIVLTVVAANVIGHFLEDRYGAAH
jgi:peptide/nickel transport system permease protein